MEGNNVEHEGTQSVPSRPRASSLELLENRLKTVGEDPTHTLCKRMKFYGRQFEFIGNNFFSDQYVPVFVKMFNYLFREFSNFLYFKRKKNFLANHKPVL